MEIEDDVIDAGFDMEHHGAHIGEEEDEDDDDANDELDWTGEAEITAVVQGRAALPSFIEAAIKRVCTDPASLSAVLYGPGFLDPSQARHELLAGLRHAYLLLEAAEVRPHVTAARLFAPPSSASLFDRATALALIQLVADVDATGGAVRVTRPSLALTLALAVRIHMTQQPRRDHAFLRAASTVAWNFQEAGQAWRTCVDWWLAAHWRARVATVTSTAAEREARARYYFFTCYASGLSLRVSDQQPSSVLLAAIVAHTKGTESNSTEVARWLLEQFSLCANSVAAVQFEAGGLGVREAARTYALGDWVAWAAREARLSLRDAASLLAQSDWLSIVLRRTNHAVPVEEALLRALLSEPRYRSAYESAIAVRFAVHAALLVGAAELGEFNVANAFVERYWSDLEAHDVVTAAKFALAKVAQNRSSGADASAWSFIYTAVGGCREAAAEIRQSLRSAIADQALVTVLRSAFHRLVALALDRPDGTERLAAFDNELNVRAVHGPLLRAALVRGEWEMARAIVKDASVLGAATAALPRRIRWNDALVSWLQRGDVPFFSLREWVARTPEQHRRAIWEPLGVLPAQPAEDDAMDEDEDESSASSSSSSSESSSSGSPPRPSAWTFVNAEPSPVV